MGKPNFKSQGYSEPIGDIKIRQLIKARSKMQGEYLDSIKNYTITIAAGPAGTGKTYLAIASALKALETNEVNRIVITRPVVESGEKLGYLPGGIDDKMDPYVKPIMDAIVELVGGKSARKLFETYVIEVCPLAYMRGRTFKNSFIIADEMSSSNPDQMKNLLTRLGTGSKMVIIGDVAQSDLPVGRLNGLSHLLMLMKAYGERPNGFNLIQLGHGDIIRHPLIWTILDLYGEIKENFQDVPMGVPAVESRIYLKK